MKKLIIEKLTTEIDENKSIKFLHPSTAWKNSKNEFAIYNETLRTGRAILGSSKHPHQHQMAAFNNIIHPLLNIIYPRITKIKN